MDILWSPWRMKYIVGNKGEGCILCNVVQKDDQDVYIIYRGVKSYIILNLYPYNTGHLMIVPYRHVPSIELLEHEEIDEMMNLLKISVDTLREVYKPEGLNIGINIGRASGAGVEQHIHIHVIPRWIGDLNFIALTSNTKVMPETLEDTYKKLKEPIVNRVKRLENA
ncbi:HIT family hydrolase [Sulfolobales archaeon HS-7]|nr:HIT family hydrolase [Sulfolobales archaeon HS-7]